MAFWSLADVITPEKIRASSQLPAPLGGDWTFRLTESGFAVAPGHVIAEIDGTNLPAAAFEVRFMAKVDAGTGQARLWNITAGNVVGAAINITATTDTLHKIQNLTLAAGLNQYRLEAGRGTTWVKVWGGLLLPEYS